MAHTMISKSMTPRQAAKAALAALRAEADPVKAAGASRYFKEKAAFFGVSSPRVRAIAADLYRDLKGRWTFLDAVELCEILFPKPELEAKGVAALVLSRFRKEFPESLFGRIKSWLEKNYLDNWASVDVFCTDVLGFLVETYPGLEKKIRTWTSHPNIWVRRAAVVAFIKPAKKSRYGDTIYGIVSDLFADREDLIHKACGWLLREAGKCDRDRLEKFLLLNGPAVPRTTLRYAIERFPEPERRRILETTRFRPLLVKRHPVRPSRGKA